MRIPPVYEKPGWQRFFAGVVIGAVISWIVFLYQFGVLQEEQIQLITTQKNEITHLKDQKDVLLEDVEKLNEENEKKLKIQDFKIEFLNQKKYGIRTLDLHNLRDDVKKDLNFLIGKDVESVSKTSELLKSTIENRIWELDEKKYKLKSDLIVLGTTLEISLNIELVK